jgi:NADH dehydrogenase
MKARPHVVVVGAGFGGLSAARGLRHVDVDVTIVDRHNYHTFLPLLYQVATAGLNAADVAHAVRGIFQNQPNVRFRQANVESADWGRGVLRLDDGELPFDYLVLAAGASPSWFGIPGAQEHGFPLYSLTDAIRLRNHILARFEAADADPALADDGALTFVIAGGGPTGVEVAGALTELIAMVLRKDFRSLDVGKARVILVELVDHVLPPFKEPSQRHARTELERRHVELRLGDAVEEVTSTSVRLRSGEVLPAHTLVWAAGVQASPLARALELPLGRGGRIVVGPDLSVEGHPNVFAIGDVAQITDARRGVLPQLAPVAMQSGRHAAREIERRLTGRAGRPFSYFDRGTMATIGRRSAVAELPFGINLSGTPAWVAWLGLHLVYLIGFRNRASVLVNWAWNYVTWDRGPRLILRTDDGRPR